MLKSSCPSCGAGVTFQSTVSIMAVCEHCNSTIIRHDVDIEAIGKMATLQVDASPLQLGTCGDYRGAAFTVVGRIQLRFDRGLWNEWHLLFSDGRSGWLQVGVRSSVSAAPLVRVGKPSRERARDNRVTSDSSG